jgi:hypothetical protein
MSQHVRRHVGHIVGRHVAAVVEAGDGLRRREEVDASPRTRAELHARQRARDAHDRRHVARDLVGNAGRVELPPGLRELRGLDHRLDFLQGRRPDAAMPEAEDLPLLVLLRVAKRKLEEEAVELGLGQRVRALVLDRVLRGEDEERLGQLPGRPLDRHLPLLHRLEQRGLRLGRRPVDLVREQHARENGTRTEGELAAVQRQRPQEVRGEHVGCELGATELEAERARDRVGYQRLRDAGHSLEQDVAADEQRAQDPLDRPLLAHGDLRHLGNDPVAQALHQR